MPHEARPLSEHKRKRAARAGHVREWRSRTRSGPPAPGGRTARTMGLELDLVAAEQDRELDAAFHEAAPVEVDVDDAGAGDDEVA